MNKYEIWLCRRQEMMNETRSVLLSGCTLCIFSLFGHYRYHGIRNSSKLAGILAMANFDSCTNRTVKKNI